MGFLWALGGIVAGTLAAMLGGAILDYMQRLGWVVPTGEQWLIMPVVTGMAGFLGALIAVTMYGRYLSSRAVSTKLASKGAVRASVPKGMEHVPGMPVFDVEAIRQGAGSRPSTTDPTLTSPSVTRTPEKPQ